MDHIGIVVEDLAAAVAFFTELGLGRQGGMSMEGDELDRVIGLEGARTEVAFLSTPDGSGQLELIRFHAPPDGGGREEARANAPGIRHLAFVVDDLEDLVARLRAGGVEPVGEVVRFEGSFTLCYVRGPAGILVELAQATG